jgi:uncharacterized damage-inducible protein DinB
MNELARHPVHSPDCDALVEQNQQILLQIQELLDAVPAPTYQQSYAPVDSSMGTHVRHVLEFYRLFLKGLRSAPVTYERRRRDPALERDRGRIGAEVAQLQSGLAAITGDQPLAVTHCGDTLAQSSIVRELQFLLDHATHHLAMVNIVGRLAGVTLPPALGIAQATLAHAAKDPCDDTPAADA